MAFAYPQFLKVSPISQHAELFTICLAVTGPHPILPPGPPASLSTLQAELLLKEWPTRSALCTSLFRPPVPNPLCVHTPRAAITLWYSKSPALRGQGLPIHPCNPCTSLAHGICSESTCSLPLKHPIMKTADLTLDSQDFKTQRDLSYHLVFRSLGFEAERLQGSPTSKLHS